MFTLQLPKRDERGFTLIELLVVIIIIGILAAVAIPLFLDQRKLAVDASVKSDVRNTATQVQTWLAQNPGSVATDATDYASKGGNVSKSTGDTVNLSVATDGSYLVCGYAGTSAKAYTTSSAAYVYDSTSGRFGLGSCTGGIVGGGSPSSTATATPTPTVATPVWNSTMELDDTNRSKWTNNDPFANTNNPVPTAVFTTQKAYTGSYSLKSDYTSGSGVRYPSYPFLKSSLVVGKQYTITAYVYFTTANTAGQVQMQTGNIATSSNAALNYSATPTWTKMSLTFTPAGSDANAMYVRFSANTGDAIVYIDDLQITPVN